MILRRIFATAFLVILSVASGLQAQQSKGASEPITKHIPDSAFAGVALFPQQFKSDKQFEMFPYEVVTAWGKRELGFDPMDATQITLIAKAPEDMQTMEQQPPNWAAIMHFKSNQKLSGVMIDQLAKDPSGKVYIGSMRRGIPSFLVVDDKTIIVGDDAWFDDLLKAGADSSLGKLMKTEMAGGGDLVAVIDVQKNRPLLDEMVEQVPQGLPPAFNRLKELPKLVNSKVVRFDFKTAQLMLQLNCVDAVAAERTKKIMTKAMSFGADMAIGGVATQMDASDEVQVASLDYFERLGSIVQRDLEPTLDGNKVMIEVKRLDTAIVPTLVGMILPAVQAARSAARRQAAMNSLKMQSLACLNYESTYNRFPDQANYDKNGKPLLSWRVHILPFMVGQNELYEQFHLDEPWDSDHNKTLIAKMPIVYESPSVVVPEGKTVYLGVAGEGGIFTKQKTTFRDITDGSSNTAAIVEVNPELAVEWTKPQDYECNRKNPLQGLGSVQPGGFMVALIDGSTHLITNDIDPQDWWSITQIADGKEVYVD